MQCTSCFCVYVCTCVSVCAHVCKYADKVTYQRKTPKRNIVYNLYTTLYLVLFHSWKHRKKSNGKLCCKWFKSPNPAFLTQGVSRLE